MADQTEQFAAAEAISRVGSANPQFLAVAADAINACRADHVEFSVDDVWPYMPPDVPVTDNRAMGAAMYRAKRQGLILPTDRHAPSTRKGCHGHPRRIWLRVVHS